MPVLDRESHADSRVAAPATRRGYTRVVRQTCFWSLALMLSTSHAASFDEQCAVKLPPSRVTVNFPRPMPTYRRQYDVRTLTAHTMSHRKSAMKAPLSSGYVLGRTVARSTFRMRPAFTFLVDKRTGYTCASLDLTVDLAYSDMTVDLSTELAPLSCEYQTTLNHENAHVAVYLRQWEWARSQATSGLRQTITPSLRLSGGAPDEIVSNTRERLRSNYLPWLRQLMSTAEAHAALDSPEEYARLRQFCVQ